MDHKSTLLAHLGSQRRHVLGILEGLSDDDLRRAVLPSGWSPVQLVHHLAVDVERFWFRGAVAAEAEVNEAVAPDAEGGWTLPQDITCEAVMSLYRNEIELANAVIARTRLDAAPAWWPRELFGVSHLDDLADVMLHVITETATHAGHHDAARELVDGRQWMVLD
jgi:hypothetical protein